MLKFFAVQKLLTFFQQNISEYCILNPLKQLTKWPLKSSLSQRWFEQLDPGLDKNTFFSNHCFVYVVIRIFFLLKIKTWNKKNLPLWDGGQITLSKNDEICPLAIPNQMATISMHIPSLVKYDWYLLKLSGNENMDVWWADKSVKN